MSLKDNCHPSLSVVVLRIVPHIEYPEGQSASASGISLLLLLRWYLLSSLAHTLRLFLVIFDLQQA